MLPSKFLAAAKDTSVEVFLLQPRSLNFLLQPIQPVTSDLNLALMTATTSNYPYFLLIDLPIEVNKHVGTLGMPQN